MVEVSIIIPSYQSADLLPRAIQSAQEQTLSDFEVIIMDDGSRDNTEEVAQRLIADDPRIRYYKKENGGAASARNRAIEHAQGTYLAFLDADDYWYPHKLADQLAIFQADPSIGMVFTNSENINLQEEDHTVFSDLYAHILNQLELEPIDGLEGAWAIANEPTALRRIVFTRYFIHTSSIMVKRELFNELGGFNEIHPPAEDMEFVLRFIKHGGKIAYWDKPSAKRYKTEISVSNRSEKSLRARIRNHRDYINLPEHADLRDMAEKRIVLLYRSLIRFHGRNGETQKAFKAFQESQELGFDLQSAVFAYSSFMGPLPFVVGGQMSRTLSALKGK